mmetsp:Transcript_20796/g.50879  ORF Transcript_20796/g.50879 Transcript_20796/m.50879 type:complete len:208 (+) Transcript_20796:840-1463(+)
MWNVSCASRAGCCCGWNSESKFQKPLSTHRLVGISEKPISRKIWRNSLRALYSGCSTPPFGRWPSASRLSGLNVAVFHAPLASMAAVRSTTGATNVARKPAAFVTLYVLRLNLATSRRLVSAATDRSLLLSNLASGVPLATARSAATSASSSTSPRLEASATSTPPAFLSTFAHRRFITCAQPTFTTCSPSSATSSSRVSPLSATVR